MGCGEDNLFSKRCLPREPSASENQKLAAVGRQFKFEAVSGDGDFFAVPEIGRGSRLQAVCRKVQRADLFFVRPVDQQCAVSVAQVLQVV